MADLSTIPATELAAEVERRRLFRMAEEDAALARIEDAASRGATSASAASGAAKSARESSNAAVTAAGNAEAASQRSEAVGLANQEGINASIAGNNAILAGQEVLEAKLDLALDALDAAPPPDTNTPPPARPYLEEFLARVSAPDAPPGPGLLRLAEGPRNPDGSLGDGPNYYDLARNVAPAVEACCELFAVTGDAPLLEVPRALYAAARHGLRERGRGALEFRQHSSGNDKMDSTLTYAAILWWATLLPDDDPDAVFWIEHIKDDWLGTIWSGGLPEHNLTHPALARAVLHALLGSREAAAGIVSTWLANTTTVMVPGDAGDRTARAFRHHLFKEWAGQQSNYARYSTQLAAMLVRLGVAPESLLPELAALVSHYALTGLDPLVIEPSIVDGNSPPTGLEMPSHSTHYGASSWGVWPGFTMLAPYDETGELQEANLLVMEARPRDWAPVAGLALAEAVA